MGTFIVGEQKCTMVAMAVQEHTPPHVHTHLGGCQRRGERTEAGEGLPSCAGVRQAPMESPGQTESAALTAQLHVAHHRLARAPTLTLWGLRGGQAV